MGNGFYFELYEQLFKNCFIHSSRYANGNLQLSLFGFDDSIKQIAHFADITLNQKKRKLKNNEIIVDCKFRPNLIPQLKSLGVIKEQVGIFADKSTLYPIYTIDQAKVNQNSYCMHELVAA